jgi:pre-rRNA-processing protein TSR3
MSSFLPTLILRHRKENLKKCSLRGLETRVDLRFFTYPQDHLPDLSDYILLTLDAPVLSKEDSDKGLFLIDGTWKYADTMFRALTKPHTFALRSLPTIYQTAYPRRQEDPRGLSSIEALYVAYCITGRDPAGLFDFYHWREAFLNKNQGP